MMISLILVICTFSCSLVSSHSYFIRNSYQDGLLRADATSYHFQKMYHRPRAYTYGKYLARPSVYASIPRPRVYGRRPIKPAKANVPYVRKLSLSSKKSQYRSQVNPNQYTNLGDLGVKFTKEQTNSPAVKAALAFLDNSDLDSCGAQAKVYIETILNGGTVAQANSEAASVNIKSFNAGERPASGSPCEAAETAFRNAVQTGENPVLSAALAFVQSSGSDSPCSAAAGDYIAAVLDGKENPELAAAKSFARQTQTLAAQGKPTIDEECSASAKAYASSASSFSSSPLAAATEAFINKALETGNGFDPVCYSAAEKYFDSFESGEVELASTFVAARDFLSEYKSSPIPASQSPCAAATKAYVTTLKDVPSTAQQNALIAFIDEAVFSGDEGLDPVCAAAAEAYFGSYIDEGDEEAASDAAAVAYLDALAENPDFDSESPCGKAAQAYIDSFE